MGQMQTPCLTSPPGEDVSVHERVTVGPSDADMLTDFYPATLSESVVSKLGLLS